jgi:twinkle protein
MDALAHEPREAGLALRLLLAREHPGLPARRKAGEAVRRQADAPRRRRAHAEDEIDEATGEMDEWFTFVLPAEKKPNPSLADVVLVIEEDFKRRGLWGDPTRRSACVIDPWNELEHFRPHGMSLTEYVGESLSMLRQWARRNMLHVFIIGHPAKQPRNRDTGKLPVATPDMISDSAHFWNKSDNCITVVLVDEHRSQRWIIHVQKIRFSHIGSAGRRR